MKSSLLALLFNESPELTFGDSFGRADGPLGNGWRGDTWSIVSNTAVNNPTLSADLLSNGNLETWSDATHATGWTVTVAGTTAITKETTTIHGGTSAAKLAVDGSNSNGSLIQTVAALAQNDWLLMRAYAQCSNTGAASLKVGMGGYDGGSQDRACAASYGLLIHCGYLGTTNKDIRLIRGSSATSRTIYIDDVTVQRLTKASMFATRKIATDYNISANITTLPGAAVGLVGSLDDPNNPSNFIVALIDGAGVGGTGSLNVFSSKTVAGVTSALTTDGAGTYVAGETLQLIKVGSTVWIYYKRVKVGTYTVSDATVISNPYGGMFSMYPDNNVKLTNYQQYAVTSAPYIWEIGDSKTVGNNGSTAINPNQDGDRTYIRNGSTAMIESVAMLATSGWKVANVKAGIDAALAAASVQPTYIFLNIGANDATGGTLQASFESDLQYVVDAIYTKWSGAVPMYWDRVWVAGYGAQCATVNGWINGKITANAAKNMRAGLDETIWMENGDNGATYVADGTHPNGVGYSKRADMRKALVGLPK